MKKTFLHLLENNNKELVEKLHYLQTKSPIGIYCGLTNHLKERSRFDDEIIHEISLAMATAENWCDTIEEMFPNSDPTGQSGPTEEYWYVSSFFDKLWDRK